MPVFIREPLPAARMIAVVLKCRFFLGRLVPLPAWSPVDEPGSLLLSYPART